MTPANVLPFRQYVRRGDPYRVVVDSIVLEGKIYWVRFHRVEAKGSAKSQWLGRTTFAQRFKEAK